MQYIVEGLTNFSRLISLFPCSSYGLDKDQADVCCLFLIKGEGAASGC